MTDAAIAVIRHLKSRAGHVWDDVSDLIIRPPRAEYHVTGLGPKIFRTSAASKQKFEREDFELENYRGLKLQCSWYRPLPPSTGRGGSATPSASPTSVHSPSPTQQSSSSGPTPVDATVIEKIPCVIYLHGNSGCRLDSRDCLFMLDEGMSVFTFDFSGSGLSEGEWVTLGFLERQDLLRVVEYLLDSKRVSTIGLWGRSMGAVTAVMYAARDPSIAAIVCDSPFSSLRLLAQDLAILHANWVPSLAVKGIVSKIRTVVLERAGFDIKDLDTLKYARMCATVPAFIFHGKDDDFVRYEHSQAVAEHYAGSCMHHLVEGDHNSSRGSDVRDVAKAFLRLYLIEKPKAMAAQQPTMPRPQFSNSSFFASPNVTATSDITPTTTPSATPTPASARYSADLSTMGNSVTNGPIVAHSHLRTDSIGYPAAVPAPSSSVASPASVTASSALQSPAAAVVAAVVAPVQPATNVAANTAAQRPQQHTLSDDAKRNAAAVAATAPVVGASDSDTDGDGDVSTGTPPQSDSEYN